MFVRRSAFAAECRPHRNAGPLAACPWERLPAAIRSSPAIRGRMPLLPECPGLWLHARGSGFQPRFVPARLSRQDAAPTGMPGPLAACPWERLPAAIRSSPAIRGRMPLLPECPGLWLDAPWERLPAAIRSSPAIAAGCRSYRNARSSGWMPVGAASSRDSFQPGYRGRMPLPPKCRASGCMPVGAASSRDSFQPGYSRQDAAPTGMPGPLAACPWERLPAAIRSSPAIAAGCRSYRNARASGCMPVGAASSRDSFQPGYSRQDAAPTGMPGPLAGCPVGAASSRDSFQPGYRGRMPLLPECPVLWLDARGSGFQPRFVPARLSRQDAAPTEMPGLWLHARGSGFQPRFVPARLFAAGCRSYRNARASGCMPCGSGFQPRFVPARLSRQDAAPTGMPGLWLDARWERLPAAIRSSSA